MDELRETSAVDDMTQDYISAIQELKQNSVDRQKYNALVAENKKLLNSIVNGQSIDIQDVPKMRDADEIRKELFSGENELSNLAYIKDALELRSVLISKGEPDPFLPVGQQIAPTDADIAAAEKVAQVLQECVDFADGDSMVFTNELQRRTIDVRGR